MGENALKITELYFGQKAGWRRGKEITWFWVKKKDRNFVE